MNQVKYNRNDPNPNNARNHARIPNGGLTWTELFKKTSIWQAAGPGTRMRSLKTLRRFHFAVQEQPITDPQLSLLQRIASLPMAKNGKNGCGNPCR
jgi:hypothetical protein